MGKKILNISFLLFILGQGCKQTDLCNTSDIDSKCGLTNMITQSDCSITALPPIKPQNLSGSPSNGQIVLNWNPSHCATKYTVYWSNAPNINPLTANKIVTLEAKLTHAGLINNVIYYYQISAENSINHKVSSLSDEVFFAPSLLTLKTYITTTTYAVPTIGSIAGADTICNNDSGKPTGGSIYKALLVDETGCAGIPCRRASISANIGDGQINWVLKPNTNYVRADGVTPIMTTNINGLFIFGTLTNGWSSAVATGISGMSGTWTTFSSLTCSNYSLNSGSVTTTQYNQTGSGSLSGAGLSCGSSYYLLCVEQ